MTINVTPIPGLDPEINDIRQRTADFINAEILPVEHILWGSRRAGELRDVERERARRDATELRDKVKAKVSEAGLWAPHLPKEYGGMGLDFLALAYMYEILAYAVGAGSLFGIVAPNSGNANILVKYGTEEQKRRWLLPLIDGTMESGFSMTEPDNAGSDPRSIRTEAVRDGDHWVINGHKWFTSNGDRADFFIVMCRANDPSGELGQPGHMTQIIVPADTPGVNIVRGIGIFGHSTSDHCEIRYENVRVPIENTLGLVGQGHQAAQDRLGAGRVYHCMNSIGQMWRAFDMTVERTLTREVHGGLLKDKQFIQGFIADSYMDVQSARLMTIDAAQKVASGSPDLRTAISAIKVFVPAAYHRVVDRAIQVWGGAGVSNDLPLGQMYLTARVLRLADGPDEVHRILMAKNILHHFERGQGWNFAS
ncbi:MAG TPA: acyl-CoA dehydrogenase family protein [Acidimicrobiales bacterium]|nr:acyl-CoA dehydrogenase family protein [Acidimicrobiales bacterium]